MINIQNYKLVEMLDIIKNKELTFEELEKEINNLLNSNYVLKNSHYNILKKEIQRAVNNYIKNNSKKITTIKNEILKDENNLSNIEKERLENKIENIKKKMSILNEKFKEEKDKNSKKKETIKIQKKELVLQNERINELDSMIDNYKEKADNDSFIIVDLESEKSNLNKYVKEKETEIQQLKEELIKERSDVFKLGVNNEILKSQIEKFNKNEKVLTKKDVELEKTDNKSAILNLNSFDIKILKFLVTGTSYNDMVIQTGSDIDTIKQSLMKLHKFGYQIKEQFTQNGVRLLLSKEVPIHLINKEIFIEVKNSVKAILISDTHIEENQELMKKLNIIYNYASINDCNYVINVGDISEGCRKKRYDNTPGMIQNQIKYVIDNYPKYENITTFMITGNHDEWAIKDYGINIGQALTENRDDIVLCGYSEGNIMFNNRKFFLHHPNDGTEYSAFNNEDERNNRLKINSKEWDFDILDTMNKVIDVICRGHYHRSFKYDYEGTMVLCLPSVKKNKNINLPGTGSSNFHIIKLFSSNGTDDLDMMKLTYCTINHDKVVQITEEEIEFKRKDKQFVLKK